MLIALFLLFTFISKARATQNPFLQSFYGFHQLMSSDETTPNFSGGFIQNILLKNHCIESQFEEATKKVNNINMGVTSTLEKIAEYERILQEIEDQQLEVENGFKKDTKPMPEEYAKYLTKHQGIEKRLQGAEKRPKMRERLEKGMELVLKRAKKYAKGLREIGEKLPPMDEELKKIMGSMFERVLKYRERPELTEDQLPQIKNWLKGAKKLVLEDISECGQILEKDKEAEPQTGGRLKDAQKLGLEQAMASRREVAEECERIYQAIAGLETTEMLAHEKLATYTGCPKSNSV